MGYVVALVVALTFALSSDALACEPRDGRKIERRRDDERARWQDHRLRQLEQRQRRIEREQRSRDFERKYLRGDP